MYTLAFSCDNGLKFNQFKNPNMGTQKNTDRTRMCEVRWQISNYRMSETC